MALVIGFAELLGAALLLTSAITGASFADVVKGHAGQLYRQNVASEAAGASAGDVNAATGAVGGTGHAIGTSGKAGLTTGQAAFANRLSARTGLSTRVISAWLLAEEAGSAAQARQAAGNHDWLNIGYTDSSTLGASNRVWTDPVSAADATAAWLSGNWSDPGFGRASSGIQRILSSAGQSASAQIHAIQSSGWASSGYPSLPNVYAAIAP